LILAFSRGAGSGGVVFVEEGFDDASNEFEITVGKHFFGEFSNSSNELLELTEDGSVFKVFEAVTEFLSGFAVDDEEGIFDATDGSAGTMANIVVEDVAKVVGTRDGNFVAILFGHGGSFAAGFDGITADVTYGDGIGDDRFDLFENGGDIAETCALLEVFGCDEEVFRYCGADSVGWAE